jgi:hypothetical protein
VALGPLNPFLLNRLRQEFGQVVIASPGEEMVGAYRWDPLHGRRFEMVAAGEYYRVNCPFCRDSRKRLWVHHRWGRPDDQTGDERWWSAVCYNDTRCLSNQDHFRDLKDRVYGHIGRDRRRVPVYAGVRVEHRPLSQTALPGTCVSLAELPPNHHANAYLHGRGFDPYELAATWGVTYCVDGGEWPAATGRIVAPIYMDGVLVSWQGRFVGEAGKGVPKYYNFPHAHKTQLLYGFDAAKAYPFVVLVEGFTDAWRLGPPVVAMFGNRLSAQQAHRIASRWTVVVVFADNLEAYYEGEDRYAALRGSGRTFAVALDPHGRDPGDCPREEGWRLVYDAAKQQGVDLYDLYHAV